MPNLAQSLQGYDLGHLTIVAELWGLALDAPDTHLAMERLTHAMLDHQQIDEILQTLSEEARAGLDDLLRSGGRLPWSLFTRRYGQVREMGPARRDREQPHLDPVSPAEMLWYRALVARAFFDSSDGPEEFAYIPDDLIHVLPEAQPVSQQDMGRPATPSERALAYLATDHILDDACTLLAALRLGLSLESLLLLLGSAPCSLSPDLLRALLASTGLIDAQDMPLPEPTRLFLEAERGEAQAQLARAWLNSRTYNELALLPEVSLEGEWTNDPRRARRAILDFLATIPPDTWWGLRSFITAVYQQFPDFQRPAGDYDSWFIRDRRTGEYLRGFEHWEQVDGTLIRFLITGPLHWLGIVDLAAHAAGEPVSAFRFSEWSADLLSEVGPPGLPGEEDVMQVRSDARIRIPCRAPRAMRYQVSRFCDWEGRDGEIYRYRLTPTSLQRANQQGLRLSHLLVLLRRHTATVPPSLVKALERWEEQGSQARLERLLVLRLSSAEILQELRASRATRFLGEPLGPTAVIVKPGAREKVLAALAEMGYLGESRLEDE